MRLLNLLVIERVEYMNCPSEIYLEQGHTGSVIDTYRGASVLARLIVEVR